MSENRRMVVIVLVFLLLGGILWGVFSRGGFDGVEPELAGSPDLSRDVGVVPEFEFDEIRREGVVDEALEVEEEVIAEVEVSSPSFGKISGRVVSSFDEKPVREFKILVVNGEYSPEMDEDFKFFYPPKGNFTARGVSPSEAVSLRVRALGFLEGVVHVDGVRGGETVEDVVVSLEPEVVLEGYVVDRRGAPIEGATIYKGFGPSSMTGDSLTGMTQKDMNEIGISDSEGYFAAGGLLKGGQLFSVYHAGHSPVNEMVDIELGRNTIHLVLWDGGTLEGTVRYNRPVAENEEIASGKVMVRGITSSGEQVTIVSNRATLLAMLSGEIFSNVGRRGDRFRFHGSCDENGFFSIADIPEGRGYVNFEFATFGSDGKMFQRTVRREIEIAAGMTTELNLVIEGGTSSVQGYVMSDEREIEGGQIQLWVDTGDHTESFRQAVGEDGFYEFLAVPSGIVSIRFSRRNEVDWTSEFLAPNEDLRLDIHLDGGATIRCNVHNPPIGKHISGFLVHESTQIPEEIDARSWLFQHASRVMDAKDGFVMLSGIGNGSYRLVVTAGTDPFDSGAVISQMEFVTAPVVVRDGVDVDIQVSF